MVTPASTNRHELPSTGPQHAMCYACISLGEQRSMSEQYPKPKFEIVYLFELEERMTNGEFAGKRFGLSVRCSNYSGTKSKQWSLIKNWLNVEIDAMTELDEITVGQPALVTITHYTKRNGDQGAKITTVSPPMRSFKPWALENGPTIKGWKYPRWISAIRKTALQPPDDINCEWEASEDETPDVVQGSGEQTPF